MGLNTPPFWRKRSLTAWALTPVSVVFRLITGIRRLCYRIGLLRSWQCPVPVAVIGNLTAGGAGKTPLVIALVDHLIGRKKSVGVVTRGYGGSVGHKTPVFVSTGSDPAEVGDEALLLARRTGVPVVAGRDRPAAIRYLLSQHNCDVIISDDGLQHYALQRDIEVVVIDHQYQFGNGFCLPAGPLREPAKRADSADLIVYSGIERTLPGYELQANSFIESGSRNQLTVESFTDTIDESGINAVAAIAHPEKFFESLKAMGLRLVEHRFPDHYSYKAADLEFSNALPIVMTEKDHVKCEGLISGNYWYLKVSAAVDGIILDEFDRLLTLAELRVHP